MSILSLNNKHYQGLFWLFIIFISYKFVTPSEHSGINIPHLDKIAHCGIFFILSGLAHQAYKLKPTSQLIIWSLYGMIIELIQGQTGYRSADIFDWCANMLGVLILLIALHLRAKYEQSN